MALAVQYSTIMELFDRITKKFQYSDHPMYMYKLDGVYRKISFQEFRRDVERFALGLASLGVHRGDHASIIAENRPEWIVADMALMNIGAVNCPIYPTLTAKQLEFIYSDASVRCVVVSNQFQLAKVLKARPHVRSVRHIIVMNESTEISDHDVFRFSEILLRGDEYKKEHPNFFEQNIHLVKPSDVATIIYTSGTTGNPKGVMLTHNNLATNSLASSEYIQVTHEDVFLSFLPLCHSFERIAGYTLAMGAGTTVAFAESVDKVAENILEIRPTIMTTVPRLFERIQGKILRSIESCSPREKRIFNWAMGVGRRYSQQRRTGRISLRLKTKRLLADKLVFKKIRARLGGRIRFFASGGAALSRELGEFFDAVGIPILEGYGLTESSPVIAVNQLDSYKFGTVGKPIPGIEVKIAADGEILTRGPHVMAGYWNNREATKEIIDHDGWLHTGDIGSFDAEGFLRITDRKKHLFVSSGGKNIAPQPIENMFLQSKYIDQFVLIGDRRMFLSALIVPDFDAIKEYADSHNIPYKSFEDLTQHSEIHTVIERDISVIQKDLANYERVRKFMLLHKKLTVEDDEITPTLKVKRKEIEERYRHIIEKMYRDRE